MTHMLTLTVLRDELRAHKAPSIFRILVMVIMMEMLMYVLIPLGYLTSVSAVPGEFSAWRLYRPDLEWKRESVVIRDPLDADGLSREYNWIYITFTSGTLAYSLSTRILLLSQSSLYRALIFPPFYLQDSH